MFDEHASGEYQLGFTLWVSLPASEGRVRWGSGFAGTRRIPIVNAGPGDAACRRNAEKARWNQLPPHQKVNLHHGLENDPEQDTIRGRDLFSCRNTTPDSYVGDFSDQLLEPYRALYAIWKDVNEPQVRGAISYRTAREFRESGNKVIFSVGLGLKCFVWGNAGFSIHSFVYF